MARTLALKLYKPLNIFSPQIITTTTTTISFSTLHCRTPSSSSSKKTQNYKNPTPLSPKSKMALEGEKRRTRSDKLFNADYIHQFGIDKDSHFPVLLGEILDVFSSSFRLRSFIDCTLGAAGHSSAIIQAHPELQTYIGLDVDPIAHGKARARIDSLLKNIQSDSISDMKVHILLKNFKHIRKVVGLVDDELLTSGVDGILMDLGMSSMQIDDSGRGFSILNNGPLDMRMDPEGSLTAEDILNSWPATEVGRILRDYGEESNWYFLQNKIVQARLGGGLHSTADLANLIRSTTYKTKGGRQGWIKTASRVFQALRIAVNDELKTLEQSLYSCFKSLGPGGRLAVISFHSLEDRIVKQTFLDIINNRLAEKEIVDYKDGVDPTEIGYDLAEKEHWIKQVVKGSGGIILTKRPITASMEEESFNSRCRSAKLRVIQKY
ncbi:hypothetical protein KSS87_005761 [Heliosperma pusillum]|nr:hypothetical protein KSS87_005761 [Heliosperma pusillum]